MGPPTPPGLALIFVLVTLASCVTLGKSPNHLKAEFLHPKLKFNLANSVLKTREAWKAINTC